MYTEDSVPFKVKPNKSLQKRLASKHTHMEMVDPLTGNVQDVVVMPESGSLYFDTSRYVKLYDTGILVLLSTKALRVLFYIMSVMGYGEVVIISLSDCKKFTGYSQGTSIYDGLKELEEFDIIKKKTLREYYVNPNVFYRGRREKYGKRFRKNGV